MHFTRHRSGPLVRPSSPPLLRLATALSATAVAVVLALACVTSLALGFYVAVPALLLFSSWLSFHVVRGRSRPAGARPSGPAAPRVAAAKVAALRARARSGRAGGRWLGARARSLGARARWLGARARSLGAQALGARPPGVRRPGMGARPALPGGGRTTLRRPVRAGDLSDAGTPQGSLPHGAPCSPAASLPAGRTIGRLLFAQVGPDTVELDWTAQEGPGLAPGAPMHLCLQSPRSAIVLAVLRSHLEAWAESGESIVVTATPGRGTVEVRLGDGSASLALPPVSPVQPA